MRYLKLNIGPNRKVRRTLNAVALRAPTPENIKSNNEAQKAPRNTPHVNPKRGLKPKGKSARRVVKEAA